MTLHIYAYNEGSEGARALAETLGIRRIRRERSTYQGSPRKTVINWGASEIPAVVAQSRVLNAPQRVRAMSNKRTFFELMEIQDVRIPEWTTDAGTALNWLAQDRNARIVERHTLNGHSGAGIRIVQNRLDMQQAPLYTKYIPKKAEYRVHFAGGQIIDVQRKIRDPNREPTNWHVRSHDNGFIFVRNGVQDAMPHDVLEQASIIANVSGLDFGAVDVIYNESRGMAYVLEVNTAPGLTGETVNSYANYFRQFA